MEPAVKTPVYHESAAYARENGELEQFRNSHWTNIACKNDIEDAIARHFDGMHLDKEAVTEVLDRYGNERVSLVLAATVQVKAWDGRFSHSNKDWAFSVDVADDKSACGFDRRDEYAVSSHPAVLDGFIKLVRQEIKELEKQKHIETNVQIVDEDPQNLVVLLTDSQEVKITEVLPDMDSFDAARHLIGCEWIEIVEPEPLARDGYVLLIDEEGKLKAGNAYVNCIASHLYGSENHGDVIVGNAMIVKAGGESLEFLTAAEAKQLANSMEAARQLSIESMSAALDLKPVAR